MRSRALLLMACLVACIGMPAALAQSVPLREYRVLLVGNSITYTNNLPALLRAVGASHGTAIATETYAAPGGALAQRWKDGKAAAALQARKFDAVVLQERSEKLADCMDSPRDLRRTTCAASLDAFKAFAELAKARDADVLVFATWGFDERRRRRPDPSAWRLAEAIGARVFDAAGTLKSLHAAQPEADLLPDGLHPSTQASLMLALALYRDITGKPPLAKELRVTAPLWPVNAAVSPRSSMESQPGLAGNTITVVPVSLVEPLVNALPPAPSGEMDPARRPG